MKKVIDVEAIVEQLPEQDKQVVDTNLPVAPKVKANKAEKEQRKRVVLNLLAEGLPRFKIVDELKRMYNLSERQCDRYFEEAYGDLCQSYKDDVEANKSQSLEWYFEHRNRCIQEGEFTAATQCQIQIDKLRGLGITNKVELSGKDGKDLPIIINIVSVEPDAK